MPNITEAAKSLNEQRIKALNDANAIADVAIAENRATNVEENEQIARFDAAAADFAARVKELDDRERREHESAVAREAFERQHGSTGADRQVRSEMDELRAWAQGRERRSYDGPDRDSLGKNAIEVNVRAAAREKDLIRRGYQGEELRALLWDTGSVASAVPTTMARTLYEYLEAGIAAFRMPTTKVTTDGGEPMHFPKLGAHAIATQVIAQGTAIGGTDPTFARMQLDAYKYGELVAVANEVLQDSGVDMAAFLGRDIGRAIARVVDADLVVGTGTGEPQGMITAALVGAAGSVVTGGSLIQPTVEKLIDLVYSVNDEYRQRGPAWLMRDASAGVIRKFRDGGGGTVGAFLWEPSLTAGIQNGQPDRLFGYPVYTDPNVASMASNARIVAFGDFSAYYIRQVGNVVIERSDDYLFNVDETAFRGKWRVDGDWIDLTAANVIVQNV